jgi:hypothetical protein
MIQSQLKDGIGNYEELLESGEQLQRVLENNLRK